MAPRELIMLLLMCLVWGSHIVVLRMTAGSVVDPMFYAAVRMTLVALILSPLLKIHRGQMIRIACAGFGLGGFNYAFMFTGLSYAPASIGAMVMELYVPITMVMAVIFLKERIGLPRITGMVVALSGVALIAWSSTEAGGGEAPLIGIGLLILAILSEATGAIFVKKIEGVKPMELLGWFAIFGASLLWTGTLLFETDQLAVIDDGQFWVFIAALSFTVFGASLFGHTTYYWLLQRLPVNQVSSSTLLATVIAVAGGVVFLGEPVTWQFILGGTMTLAGVGVILFRTRPKQPPASTVAPLEN